MCIGGVSFSFDQWPGMLAIACYVIKFEKPRFLLDFSRSLTPFASSHVGLMVRVCLCCVCVCGVTHACVAVG